MTSINPATRPQDELNDFTNTVRQFFNYNNDYGRTHYRVRLRNSDLVRPVFKAAEDEHCRDTFQYKNDKMYYCWNLDGTSVTCGDYDMMEIVYRD